MLIEKKTEELEGLRNDHGVELSKMKQRHKEETTKLKQVQIIEAKSMACRHDKEIEKTIMSQADEQKNYVAIHTEALDHHATALESLKEELLRLKNEQVSSAINVHNMSLSMLHNSQLLDVKLQKTRPNLSDQLQAKFNITLQRDTTDGIENTRDLGEVEAEVWTEGLLHRSKCYVRMTTHCSDGKAKVIFLADTPEAATAHNVMLGNAGGQNIVVWQACNENHSQMGTTVKGANDKFNAPASRRYYLHFKDRNDLDSFLHVLGISKEEWYDIRGKFVQDTYVMPANKIKLRDNDMEADHDVLNQTMTKEETEDMYGHDVYDCSQSMW